MTFSIKWTHIFINNNSLVNEKMKNVYYLWEFLSKNSNFVFHFIHISARYEWQMIPLMDKPEDVSDSRLPTFSQNIKRDWCSFPYHRRITYLSAFCTVRGGTFSAVVRSGRPQLQTGVHSESARLPAPLLAWNSHLMQYYASRPAAWSNSKSGSQELQTFAVAEQEHTETNLGAWLQHTLKRDV